MTLELLARFASYPPDAQQQLARVRGLILAEAEAHSLGAVDETVKWGEASFRVKGGSTIRIDWKPKSPDVVKLFFHCQTRLVETFREIYPDVFEYEGNRALLIPLQSDTDDGPLRHCIELALKYQRLKHLPLLGA